MCHNQLEVKRHCLQAIATVLACVGKQLHSALDRLNNTWYRFLLYCFAGIAKGPNKTTGELLTVTQSSIPVSKRAPRQETWV